MPHPYLEAQTGRGGAELRIAPAKDPRIAGREFRGPVAGSDLPAAREARTKRRSNVVEDSYAGGVFSASCRFIFEVDEQPGQARPLSAPSFRQAPIFDRGQPNKTAPTRHAASHSGHLNRPAARGGSVHRVAPFEPAYRHDIRGSVAHARMLAKVGRSAPKRTAS